VLVGVAVAAVTGWFLAIVVVPAAVVGIPVLLSPPAAVAQIDRLVGLEEWTRALSGVLTAGVGLEQAITATLRSTPAAVKPEVGLLVGRINARWSTEAALRQFADDLGDNVGGVGDTVAATLILGARRRGGGLAPLMNDLAASVAEEVRAQRAIEADREKPRTTARWVTIITISVLGFLALTGDYIAPYGTALGQLILTVLLSAYVATLVWMRRMARGEPAPRFIGVAASQGRSV
jgi:Flp pilus assembly protein TadB